MARETVSDRWSGVHSLVELLSKSISHHPDRPALALPAGGRTISYREFFVEIKRIASTLSEAGVQPGDRVAILVPKSPEAIASLWATLHCGAAYVPIDPTAPAGRAAYIAENCEIAALIASGEVADSVEAIRVGHEALPVLQVHGHDEEEILGALECESDGEIPDVAIAPDDLAYILYTSGSTGLPKGVMISHRAALSFATWAIDRFELGSEDVMSSHAPLHFDLSTLDVFGAAGSAAKLVILDEELVRFPLAAAMTLADEKISVWYSVPGALRAMVGQGRLAQRDLSALRCTIFAGEAYPADELRTLQALAPHAKFWNLYGPTETNVCTCWEVPALDTWSDEAIPIGQDCAGYSGVVVDEALSVLESAQVGELLMCGDGVMTGYWGDEEKTRRGFVEELKGVVATGPYYRTGDLVSRRPDGCYRFHGRRDHMVKIRGYRVELGEVEAALSRVHGVREAAAIAVEAKGGSGTELIGFVVPESEEALGQANWVRGLRRELATLLPRYMVPGELKCLAALPVTSTGKIDRQELEAAV